MHYCLCVVGPQQTIPTRCCWRECDGYEAVTFVIIGVWVYKCVSIFICSVKGHVKAPMSRVNISDSDPRVCCWDQWWMAVLQSPVINFRGHHHTSICSLLAWIIWVWHALCPAPNLCVVKLLASLVEQPQYWVERKVSFQAKPGTQKGQEKCVAKYQRNSAYRYYRRQWVFRVAVGMLETKT